MSPSLPEVFRSGGGEPPTVDGEEFPFFVSRDDPITAESSLDSGVVKVTLTIFAKRAELHGDA